MLGQHILTLLSSLKVLFQLHILKTENPFKENATFNILNLILEWFHLDGGRIEIFFTGI